MSSHYPICYTKLVIKNCTPCMDCGGNDKELDHYKEHIYTEYEIINNQRLTLCNFCAVDFGSYSPTTFGLKKRIGFENFNFVKSVGKSLRLDKYCPECNHRLPFLNFVMACRLKND
ncbi:MAG: hypothetical protein AB8G11_15445 [Saprospiraceae bacterium]